VRPRHLVCLVTSPGSCALADTLAADRIPFVSSRTMVDLPQEDTAAACGEHSSCIRGFKWQAAGEPTPQAGWWHFGWDQEASQWNLTGPNGETRYVIVQLTDAPFPPAALINAVPGLVFDGIVNAIEREGLFPPP
jgi:hypothetical protein